LTDSRTPLRRDLRNASLIYSRTISVMGAGLVVASVSTYPLKLPPDIDAGSPVGNRFGYSYIEELRERAGGSFYIDADDKLRFVPLGEDGYDWHVSQ